MRPSNAFVLLVAVAVAVAAVVAGGCHGDAGPDAPPGGGGAPKSAQAPKKTGPTAADLTAGMVEAATIGKSSLAVQLKFDLAERPVVGRPLTVSLAWLPDVVADQVTVQATGTDGLAVEPSPQPALGAVEPAQAYRQSLQVTPSQEGLQLLTLNFAVKRDETADTRVFAIPVIVSAAEAGAAPAAAPPSPGAASAAPSAAPAPAVQH